MKNIQTKPKIYVDFDSPDGNIFTILAHAENAMKVYSIINAKEKASEMRDRVTKSESYEGYQSGHLLKCYPILAY